MPLPSWPLSEPTLIWSAAAAVVAAIVVPYALRFRARHRRDHERKVEAAQLGIDKPTAQFPYVDPALCLGCGACVTACPEGDVLGLVGGTATVINGLRCVGHGRCEEACPVSAIFMGKDYELAVYSKDDFVWDKTDLLVAPQAAAQTPAAAGPR